MPPEPSGRPSIARRRSRVVTALLHAFYDGFFLLFLLLTAPWFLIRIVRDRGLRSSLAGRFGAGPQRDGGRRCIWVHGVSVGEVKAARLLVEQLVRARPDHDVVISSTTAAGLALARRLFPSLLVIQFPLDLRWIVRRVLARVRPDLIVLVELEIWPNLLREAQAKAIPVAIVNGRVSERSFRGYRLLARLLPQFELIARYAVQNEEYAGRLRGLGVPDSQIVVTGNMKYDTLRTELAPEELDVARRTFGLSPETPLVVAGSTHAGEEEALLLELAGWRRARPGTRLLLAPRHVERVAEVVRVIERHGFMPARLTELRSTGRSPPPDAVLLADTIGELETFYALGSVAFVGGSLVDRGGHNMLEPAALGVPTVYGPSIRNFRDEVRLLDCFGGGLLAADRPALGAAVAGLLRESDRAKFLSDRGRAAVASIRGGTARSRDLLLSLLGQR
jgi:3-deoxy-D-manno-octulosonic-acid transferase